MKRLLTISFITLCLISPQFAFAEHGQKMKSFHKELKQERMEYWKTQKAENKEFRKGFKDLPPEEKAKAMREYHKTQYAENKAFREKLHQENADFLKTKLEHNKKLSGAQKTELINFLENQYQENVSFRERQHAENVAFFESIANNPNMTQKERKQAIKDHFKTQKSENKDFWSQQKTKRKEFKHSLHSSAPQTTT